MNRVLGIALMVVGLILVFWGLNSSHSAGSEISKVFTGSPTDKAIYLIIGGAVAAIVGAGLAFIRPRGGN